MLTPSSSPDKGNDPQSLQRAAFTPMDRRRFLGKIFSETIHAAGTAALVMPGACTLGGTIVSSNDTDKPRPEVYPLADAQVSFPNGVAFHNLGVKHIDQSWTQWSEHIIRRIDSADVVAIESIMSDGFFRKLAESALDRGKKVYVLEPSEDFSRYLLRSLAGMAPLVAAVYNIAHYFQKDRKSPGVGRTALTTAAVALQETIGMPIHPAMDEVRGRFSYHPTDVSYLSDGRSVLMLKSLFSLASENAGKRMLVATGEGHAVYLDHYGKDQNTFRTYQTRLSVYERTYGRAFGYVPQELKKEK